MKIVVKTWKGTPTYVKNVDRNCVISVTSNTKKNVLKVWRNDMVTSMEDIVAVYKERDGISHTGTADIRKEQLALLEKELYALARDTSCVSVHLQQF